MSTKFLLIQLFIFITIFLPKSLYALSGKEINTYIKKWLASEGIKSNPEFSPKKKLPNCNQNVSYEKYYNSSKLIKVSCKDQNSWTIFVQTNAKILKEKKLRILKTNQTRVLNKSIEKGHYITETDLIFIKTSKRIFFIIIKKS